MLRPTDQLSEQTCERLDAALALGARETWVDRDELGLPEPSPLGRWLCVLELPAARMTATGSSGRDPEQDAQRAALEALAGWEALGDRRPRRNRARAVPDAVAVTHIRGAQLDAALDLDEDARADDAA